LTSALLLLLTLLLGRLLPLRCQPRMQPAPHYPLLQKLLLLPPLLCPFPQPAAAALGGEGVGEGVVQIADQTRSLLHKVAGHPCRRQFPCCC